MKSIAGLGASNPNVLPTIRSNARETRVIIGPTAAGKSAVAMELARRFDIALISADSRQVYRGFDIGTAKPSAAERAEIQHFGVDVQDPRDRYSAHAWAVDSIGWMQQAAAVSKNVLIVGGTGFYVRALVRPLAAAPALDAGRRSSLERWLNAQSLDELRRFAVRLDAARATLGRTQLERAIETALLSGTRLGDAHAGHRARTAEEGTSGMPVRYLVVDPGVVLADRIRGRVHAMVDAGWIDEVCALLRDVPVTAPAWLASGYDVMRRHVVGELTREAAIEKIIIETRQYAKRQRTWCRHQLNEGPVTRVSTSDPRALDIAIAWWNGTEDVA
jgi:tRNA dimethylallyltransferase